MRHVLTFLLALLLATPAFAVGGKWTPDQLVAFGPEWLAEQGLMLEAEALQGKLDAVVQVGGCTGTLVSPEGLVLTNHHCVYGMLQEHATPERDLIAEGFLAASRAEELPGTGVRASVRLFVEDVTAEMTAVAAAAEDDLARFAALEAERKARVAACEAVDESRRCEVVAYDDGVRWELVATTTYTDVRLVWAPPAAVGELGGEVDNWSWPRHAGDFALTRIWAGPDGAPAAHDAANRPLASRTWLQLAPRDLDPGDFVMVAGYAGRTQRSLVAAEMAARVERFYPARIDVYGAWLDMLGEASEASEEGRIAVASRIKGLANREKRARGKLAGIERGRLLEKKRELEAQVLAWAEGATEHAGAVEAYRGLVGLVEASEASWRRAFLLDELRAGPMPLYLAVELVRWGRARTLPDAERDPDYQERNRDRLRQSQVRYQRMLWRDADAAILTDWLTRAAALPTSARIAAADAFLDGATEGPAIRQKVDALLAETALYDEAARLRLFDAAPETVATERDPLLALARALADDVEAAEQEEDRRQGAEHRLRPPWRRALAAFLDRPLDFDANGTLRVSLARVKGYRPRDGIWMEPQTTTAGMTAKVRLHDGAAPFAAPEALVTAADDAGRSRWADPDLGDVPIGFLATGDTTGGNSGSPMLDRLGRVVGVNFDRVWENVANDYGYNPEIARNVAVDARYLVWVLETWEGPKAATLLQELGVANAETTAK